MVIWAALISGVGLAIEPSHAEPPNAGRWLGKRRTKEAKDAASLLSAPQVGHNCSATYRYLAPRNY